MKYIIGPKDFEKACKFIDEHEKSEKQAKQQDNTFSILSMKEIRRLISVHESNELFCNVLDRMIEKYKNDDIKYKDFADFANINESVLRSYRNGIRTINRKDLLKIIIALKCSEDDAMFLMEKAGFSFDKNNKTEVVVLCHILKNEYDRANIDENLVHEGESPLFEYIESIKK
jgi:predicted transcriptional regulator